MSTPHQLWQGRVDTHIGRLRDATWVHGREWHDLAGVAPHIYEEMRQLFDVFADSPPGVSFGPPVGERERNR